MNNTEMNVLLSLIGELSDSERNTLREALDNEASRERIIRIIESPLRKKRECVYCRSHHVVKWGSSHNLQRYRCGDCNKTFNALTGTPLAGLQKRERWLDFAAALSEGLSLRRSAKRCSIATNTALRWKKRFQ